MKTTRFSSGLNQAHCHQRLPFNRSKSSLKASSSYAWWETLSKASLIAVSNKSSCSSFKTAFLCSMVTVSTICSKGSTADWKKRSSWVRAWSFSSVPASNARESPVLTIQRCPSGFFSFFGHLKRIKWGSPVSNCARLTTAKNSNDAAADANLTLDKSISSLRPCLTPIVSMKLRNWRVPGRYSSE